jgi:2-dehydro-3-deoxyphosphogluconate aldolase / (4S)-4-hydroxy-2-oxoglutarate aldolase
VGLQLERQMDGLHLTEPGARVAVPASIVASRVIAIGRGLPADRLAPIADGLAAGGVGAFEVTLNSPDALGAIASLAKRFEGSELMIGAGTVLTAAQASAALDAGARFLVMPNTDPDVIAVGVARGAATFPGAFTPSEVLVAWRAGASAVKLFPASAAGPTFVRELRGPLPEIPIVPTGGVTIETGPAFIAAGAIAIGIGSWLTGSGEPAEIGRRGASLVEALRAAGS